MKLRDTFVLALLFFISMSYGQEGLKSHQIESFNYPSTTLKLVCILLI